MQISKPLLYALVSTVADDLQIGDEFHINTWHEEVDTRNHFDYRNTVNIPPTLPTQPCPSCPDGDPGDPGEFAFTATIFGLDIDLTKLSDCFYDELAGLIMEDIVE